MVMGQYHHVLQCLTFPGDWGKVRQAKMGELNSRTVKSEKPSSKITKIEQVLEFCNKIVYLQT